LFIKIDEVKTPIATTTDTDEYTGYIPDPPSIPVDDVVLSSLGEPTLNSLGLGSYYTPVGWVQNSIEFLHTHFDLPWCAAISLTCFLIRTLMIRVTIQIQKNAAKMKVIGADMKELQDKISDAKIKGNKLEEHMLTYKMVDFMRQNGYSVGGQIFPMLAQGFVFTSGFWAIRSMCNLPVESMRQGGLSWFTDLTITDPYFILPITSIATLVYNLEVRI
jgi:YidC/Oxa1 family membrane protein insertase